MGILSSIKQLFLPKPQIQPLKQSTLTIKQLGDWIAESEASNTAIEESIKQQLLDKLNQLLPMLEEKIRSLKTLDISKYKVEDKIKVIVKENLPHYITHLDRLSASLNNISKTQANLDNFINAVNISLSDFEKRSFKPYQKATILIGKEIGDTKEAIVNFTNQINKTIKENEKQFSKKKSLEMIKKSFKDYQELESVKQEIANNLNVLNQKIAQIKKEKEEKEQEILSYKTSIPYNNFIKSQEAVKQKLLEISQELASIKKDLNIKFLYNLYHKDKKKTRLIKSYEEISTALDEDPELRIVEIIKDAALNEGAPPELSSITRERLENIRTLKNTLELKQDSRIIHYEEAIRNKDHEIFGISKEYEKEKERMDKIESKQSIFINELKNQLNTFSLLLQI